MADKCNTTDLTSMMFIACYRTQLCKSPKVCQNWKEEVCCKDDDKALKEGLKKELQALNQTLNTQQLKALKMELNKDCAARHGDCKHEHIGPIVKLNCPATCGLCQLPGKRMIAEENVQHLDDAIAGTAAAQGGWTLTPVQSMTHTPTDDQSCFVDPEGFDCSCHAKIMRTCKKEHDRRALGLVHGGWHGRTYSVAECNQFFVCTHSNTCQAYKDSHCQKEIALLRSLGRKIETC